MMEKMILNQNEMINKYLLLFEKSNNFQSYCKKLFSSIYLMDKVTSMTVLAKIWVKKFMVNKLNKYIRSNSQYNQF